MKLDFFQSLALGFLSTTFHGALVYLVYTQQAVPFPLGELTQQLPVLIAATAFFFMSSHLLRLTKASQWILCFLGCVAASQLITISEQELTLKELLKAPGYALLWLVTVIVMDLNFALLTLVWAGAFYFLILGWTSSQ